MEKYFKNQAGEVGKTSDKNKIAAMEKNPEIEEITEEEYLNLTAEAEQEKKIKDAEEHLAQETKAAAHAEGLPPITDNLVTGVKFNAASIKSNRKIGSFGLVIAAVALIIALFGILKPEYNDTVLVERVAAVETEVAKVTADAKTIADAAVTSAADATAAANQKLREDVRAAFTRTKETAAANYSKLNKALKNKVSWASLKKASNTAAAAREKLNVRINDNEQVIGVALTEAAKNTTAINNIKGRLVMAEFNLAAQKEAIIEVADRTDTFIKSAKVTRKWFLGKPQLEGEKGVFDAPIFNET
jgi:hypothetical protein